MSRDKIRQQTELFSTICRVSNQYQAIGEKYYNSISLKQEYLLWVMEDYFKSEPPTLNDLAGKIGSSHQNIKQMVVKLTEKGYLTLEYDAEDKRKRRVCFTDKYRRDKEIFGKRRQAFIRQVFDGITDQEVDNSISIIEKMMNNLSVLLYNKEHTCKMFDDYGGSALDLDK